MKITFQFKCVFGICRDLFYWHLWHVIEQARECGIDIQELPKVGSENIHVILKKKNPHTLLSQISILWSNQSIYVVIVYSTGSQLGTVLHLCGYWENMWKYW